MYGKTTNNPPSRFIDEIDTNLIESNEKKKKKEVHLNISEMYHEENVDYKQGDVVMHTIYGKGVVISVDESIITIAFSKQYGIRKLMKNHKSIRKV